MAEIKLNKPLYGDGGGDKGRSGDGNPAGPPPPRPARPALWMRVAALGVDLLLLHGVATLALKLFFQPIVALGTFGPFVGLAAATFYFAFGYSSLTSGRTVGKLVMRLQVAETRGGNDLSVVQGFLRALLILWPLWIMAAVGLTVEQMVKPDTIDAQPILLQMAAYAVTAAWFLGNFFHAWADPHGRTWIDRLVGSIEFSSDAPLEDIQAFLRSARENSDPARMKRAMTALLASVGAVVAVDAALSYFFMQQFKSLGEKERNVILTQRRDFATPGFPLPVQLPAEEAATSPEDKNTTKSRGTMFQYRKRGPLTAEDVKGSTEAMTALNRVSSAVVASLQEAARSTTGTAVGQDAPDKAKLQVGFAQFGDLFFASQATNVYSESQTLDLGEIYRSAKGTTEPMTATTTGTVETTGSATLPTTAETTGSAETTTGTDEAAEMTTGSL